MFEIEKYKADATWESWKPDSVVTKDSKLLNVRPVVPRGGKGVLWMRGKYEHYTRYGTGIYYSER